MSTSEEAEAMEWCIKNGLIDQPHDPYDWTPWVKVFRIFPRKSINGKFLWGMVHNRKRAYGEHFYFTNSQRVYKYEYQYANEKEVFKQLLKDNNNV